MPDETQEYRHPFAIAPDGAGWVLLLSIMVAVLAAACDQEPSIETPARDTVSVGTQVDSMRVGDVLRTDRRFSTLVAGLDSTKLDSILSKTGPYTLFAPPDTAFSTLPEGTVPLLMTEEVNRLRTILEHHVVEGRVSRSTLADSATLVTLSGDSIRVRVTDSTAAVGAATVMEPDIQTANGIIHVIDRVLRPPSSQTE